VGIPRRRPPLLFYCHHSIGMGHLVRSVALVRALSARFDVTFVSGGALPPFASAGRAPIVPLPAVALDETGSLVSHDGRRRLDRALTLRRQIVLDTYRSTQPRVVIVDLFPFGRRLFASELLPMLQEARADAVRPLVCCSLRDILIGHARSPDHDARAVRLLAWYFDAVLVHSDPTFATLEESLAPGVRVPVPVHYTGFVHRDAAPNLARRRTPKSSTLVSAGSGLAGEHLLHTALEAQALMPPAARRRLTLVAGPFLPDDAWRRLRRRAADTPSATIRRMVPDLGEVLRQASGSVSQCGYNTAMDLVESRVPALVVPFGAADDTEQLNRARRLEALGAVRVLPAAEMDAPRLAVEMASLSSFTPKASSLSLRGAERTVHIIDTLLDKPDTVGAAAAASRMVRTA
jgi:predicted glycosyltransferase